VDERRPTKKAVSGGTSRLVSTPETGKRTMRNSIFDSAPDIVFSRSIVALIGKRGRAGDEW
jgi:hypothetical protein